MPMPINSITDCATLHNGVKMPWLGFGVYQIRDGSAVKKAIVEAFELGYRSIDTAAMYGNEVGVGAAVNESEIKREDIFVTTKVWNSKQGYDNTLQAFEESIKKLNLDYIDLYLIHWPVSGKFTDTWKALETLYREKRVRAIGVSNFLQHHLQELLDSTEIVPMVNQMEFHPYLLQKDLLEMCASTNIQFEAWSPLMKGRNFSEPVFIELAHKYNKTPAQIILRWDLQHEVVTIPKSEKRERIKENSEIFDFEISEEDMNRIDGLDNASRFGPDPNNFNF
jgi:diketogulonate reductase-like aldo/keto reductase